MLRMFDGTIHLLLRSRETKQNLLKSVKQIKQSNFLIASYIIYRVQYDIRMNIRSYGTRFHGKFSQTGRRTVSRVHYTGP